MKPKAVKSTTPGGPSVDDPKTAIGDKPAKDVAADEGDQSEGDKPAKDAAADEDPKNAVGDKPAKDVVADEEEVTEEEGLDADDNAKPAAKTKAGKADKVQQSSLSSTGKAAISSSTSSSSSSSSTSSSSSSSSTSSSSSSSSSLVPRPREDFVWQTTNLTDEEHDQLELFVQQLMHIGYTYNGCTWNSVEEDSAFQGWSDVFVWIGVITHKVFDDFFNGRDTQDFYLGTHTEIRRLEAWLWDVEDVHFVWAGLPCLEVDRRLGLLFALLPTLAAADKRVCV